MTSLLRIVSRLPIVIAALVAAGCAGARYPQAQTVSGLAAHGEHYWVVGRYGFAAEGRGAVLHRADFPETSRTPGWAWEASSGLAGHVVELGGVAYLISEGGEVFRRQGGAWGALPTRFSSDSGPPDEDVAQVDDVLVTPDGRVLVHVHATQLYWADRGGLERGVLQREELPHYFTWLGFAHSRLHGIGWDGDLRAVFARDAKGSWSKVTSIPKGADEPKAVVALVDGRVAVVLDGELRAIDPGGDLRTIPLVDLLAGNRPALVMAAEEASAPSSPPSPSPPPSQPMGPPQPTPSPRRPDLAIAADALPPRATIQLVLRVGPGRYALVLGEKFGSAETIVILGAGPTRVVSCDILRVRRAIGVVEAPDRIYVPTQRASVVEIRGNGACSEPQVPLLPDE